MDIHVYRRTWWALSKARAVIAENLGRTDVDAAPPKPNPHGVTRFLDFRLAGRISRLIQGGFATGLVGEVLLIPGKPKLPFDKSLLFGIGKQAEFNDPSFARS